MGLKNDLSVFMDSVAEGCDDVLSNVLSEERRERLVEPGHASAPAAVP